VTDRLISDDVRAVHVVDVDEDFSHGIALLRDTKSEGR